MRLFVPVAAILPLVCLSATSWANPDEPWLGPAFSAAPGAMIAAARRIAHPDDADIDLLLEEAHHVFAEDGSSVRTYRQVYRVLTPTGRAAWSVTRAPWSPWAEHPPQIRARVIGPDGVESVLNPDDLAAVPVASELDQVWVDRKALEGPLPGVRVGSIVEEQTLWRSKPPPIAGGALRSWYLGGHANVRLSRLTVEAPASVRLRVVGRGVDTPELMEQAGRQVIEFAGGPYPAAPTPAQALPYDAPRQPRIAYSTGQSWASVAQAYSDLVDERLDDADLSSLISRAKAAAPTPKGRIAAALAEVHRRVRYSGVHFGDAAILPAYPATTLGRGFGDCKDKSTLLVGVLRGLGFEAHVALVNGAPGEDVLRGLPALGAFDHAIVRVEAPPLWIDPTDPFAAAGELPTAVMARLALVASSDSTAPIPTPAPREHENVKHEEAEFSLAAAGPPSAQVRLSMTGAFARTYRHRLQSVGRSSMTRGLKAYASSGFGLGESEGVISEESDPALPQTLELRGQDSTFGFTDKDGAHVTIPDLGLFSDLPPQLRPGETEAGEIRVDPMRVGVPYTYRFVLRVRPGPGLADPILPPDQALQWGPARLVRSSTVQADGVVVIDARFMSGGPLLTAEEAEAIRQGAAKYAEEGPLTVRFDKRGAVALAAGRYGEAISVMQEVVRAHPDIVELRGDLIGALLAAGFGDAARTEATALVDEAPTTPLSYQMLGWALQHDLIGRNLASGMDRARALAAYRRARRLDPLNPLPLPFICELLERDAHGLRFTATVDLAAAVQCRLSLPRPLDDLYNAEKTLQTLAWAGRFDDVIREGAELPRTDLGDALRVAATVITEGVGDAAHAAGRLVQSPDARRKLFDESRKALFRLGRYPDGVAWLDHVGGGPEMSRAERERLRRLRPSPVSALVGSDDPADAWRAVTALWMSPTYDRTRILERFSPGLRARLRDRPAFRSVVGAWGGWARSEPAADLIAGVSRDLAMGAASPRRVVGDRRQGWALELPELTQDAPYADSYVVPTHAGPRIAAVRGVVDSAGDEALSRMRAGDRRVAKGLLGWAAGVVRSRPGNDRHDYFLGAMGRSYGKVTAEIAAALLAGPSSPEAAEIVRVTESLPAGPPPLRRMVRRVRAGALMELGRFGDVVALLPDDPAALDVDEALLRLEALRLLGKGHRALALSRRLIGRSDVTPEAVRWAWDRAAAMGSFEDSERLRQRLFERSRPAALDLLAASWRTQFARKPDPKAVTWARRGNGLLLGRHADGLLTEAMLLAASGEPNKARERRDAARALRPATAAGPRLWLVQGRIASQEGLTELARSYYDRAAQGPTERADSPAALAKRWLKELKGSRSL